MKTLWSILVVLALSVASVAQAQTCNTIQDGGITDVKNNPVTTGYDQFGYNYEAHMFNGPYESYSRVTPADAADPNGDELVMKWNDAWLSNKDCTGAANLPDGKLDRPASYRGSGAWCTNHISGLVNVNGRMRRYTYFAKIIALPVGAVPCVGAASLSCTPEGTVIGTTIWNDFAITEEVINDPSQTARPKPVLGHPGLGNLQ